VLLSLLTFHARFRSKTPFSNHNGLWVVLKNDALASDNMYSVFHPILRTIRFSAVRQNGGNQTAEG
jgi:hypothetical protein